MDCQTCNDLLLDLAYGELDEVRAAAARRHTDGCVACRDELRRLMRGRALAKQLAPQEPPPVSAALRAAIDAAAARTQSVAIVTGGGNDVAQRGRFSRWIERIGEVAMRRQVAMAAMFLVMIGVGLVFYQTHPRPISNQDDHVPDVVPAVEVQSGPTARPPGAAATAATPRRASAAARSASTNERDERARSTMPPSAPANEPARQTLGIGTTDPRERQEPAPAAPLERSAAHEETMFEQQIRGPSARAASSAPCVSPADEAPAPPSQPPASGLVEAPAAPAPPSTPAPPTREQETIGPPVIVQSAGNLRAEGDATGRPSTGGSDRDQGMPSWAALEAQGLAALERNDTASALRDLRAALAQAPDIVSQTRIRSAIARLETSEGSTNTIRARPRAMRRSAGAGPTQSTHGGRGRVRPTGARPPASAAPSPASLRTMPPAN